MRPAARYLYSNRWSGHGDSCYLVYTLTRLQSWFGGKLGIALLVTALMVVLAWEFLSDDVGSMDDTYYQWRIHGSDDHRKSISQGQ